MAKNKPIVKPVIPQARQATSNVKSMSKNKTSGGSWFRMPDSQNKEILFGKTNYIILGVGVFLIILGFILMSGGNTDPNVFNVKEIYSTQRITVAPITVIAGFLVIVVAILKKPASPRSTIQE